MEEPNRGVADVSVLARYHGQTGMSAARSEGAEPLQNLCMREGK